MGFYFWCPQSFRVIVSDFLCGTPPRLSEPDGSFKFVRLAELDFFFFGRFCLPSFAQRCREKKLIWNSIKFFFFFFRLHGRHRFFDSIEFFFCISSKTEKKQSSASVYGSESVGLKKKGLHPIFIFFTSASTSPFFSFLFFFWGGEGYPSEAISIVWMRRPDVEPQAKEKKEEKEVAKRRSKKRLDSPCLSLDFPRSRDSLWLPLSFSACVCVCVCVCV